jgi:hypothetical protein
VLEAGVLLPEVFGPVGLAGGFRDPTVAVEVILALGRIGAGVGDVESFVSVGGRVTTGEAGRDSGCEIAGVWIEDGSTFAVI